MVSGRSKTQNRQHPAESGVRAQAARGERTGRTLARLVSTSRTCGQYHCRIASVCMERWHSRTPRWPRQVGGRYYDQRRMRYRLHGRRAAKASEVLVQRSDRVLLTMIAKAQRMLMSARPGGGSRALRSARTCTQSRGGSARTQRAGQLRNKSPAPQQFTTLEATGPPK